jgi:branched-chain amino acid transport system ATP-binding protein
VHTHIGAYHILHGVDLAVPEGEVTMLLGRNGAGKTPRCARSWACGRPARASMRFRGRAIHGRPRPTSRSRGIAYVPESMGIFTDLTVKENMVLAARAARHAGELDRRGWTGSSASSRR